MRHYVKIVGILFWCFIPSGHIPDTLPEFCSLSIVELQYASLLGLAKLTGRKPVLCLSFSDQAIDIRNTFTLSVTEDCPKSTVFHQMLEKASRKYDATLYGKLTSDCENYRLFKYTQSWRYFEQLKGKNEMENRNTQKHFCTTHFHVKKN